MLSFVDSLAIQSWTLYSIGIISTICRLVSRRMKLGGWKNLKFEDYWICFAVVCYTGVIISVNETAKNGSNYMAPELAAKLTPKETMMAIYGSKMTLVLELFQLTCLWSTKGCLVVLYYRLSEGFATKQNVMIVVGLFCAITYVLVVVLFLGYWCRPIQEYWRVPVKYSQCATYYHHMIFATACNISSDLMILAFPVTLVSTMRMELKKKIIVIGVLSLGVFSILTAVLNRYYNFSNPNSLVYAFWYVGESSTALMVANLPLCWPLLQWLLSAGPWTESGSRNQLQQHQQAPRHKQPRTGRFDRRSRRPGSPTLLSILTTETSTSTHESYGTDKRDNSLLRSKGGQTSSATVEVHPTQEIELSLTPIGGSGRNEAPANVGTLDNDSVPDGARVSRSSLTR